MIKIDPGKRIKEERQRLGWSQERLAREAKKSAMTIHNIEHGRKSPSVSTLESIASALGVHPAELLR